MLAASLLGLARRGGRAFDPIKTAKRGYHHVVENGQIVNSRKATLAEANKLGVTQSAMDKHHPTYEGTPGPNTMHEIATHARDNRSGKPIGPTTPHTVAIRPIGELDSTPVTPIPGGVKVGTSNATVLNAFPNGVVKPPATSGSSMIFKPIMHFLGFGK